MADSGEGGFARKINGERVVVLGWPRAILMQVAHPVIAAGVSQHSEFGTSGSEAVARLRRTLRAMLALTFGDEAEAARAAATINAIHDRVHGEVVDGTPRYPAGTRYSAHDPELLLWVHATFVESTALAYAFLVAPLTRSELDGYCREAAAAAARVGIPACMAPASWDALRRYVNDVLRSDEIEVTQAARAIASEVLRPPFPRALRPATWLAALPSIALLDPGLRAEYGLRWSRSDQQLARHVGLASRAAHILTPGHLRSWPEARRQPPTGAHSVGREGLPRAKRGLIIRFEL